MPFIIQEEHFIFPRWKYPSEHTYIYIEKLQISGSLVLGMLQLNLGALLCFNNISASIQIFSRKY